MESITEELPPGTFLFIKDNETTAAKTLILSPTPSDDPNDPLNWSNWRKAWSYTLVLAVTVAVFSALSTQLNLWQQMVVDMNVTYAELNNSVSVNSAGCTMGCVLFIPFTKKYGRRSTYILSTLVLAAISWWSSRMETLTELYISNLFFGLAGSVNETIVQMTIADMFFVHQRGRMNALYLSAVMIGSFLIPMAAGQQAAAQGWRESYYALAISLTLLTVIFVFGCEETKYTAVIEANSEQRSITETEDDGRKIDTNTKSTPIDPTAPESHPRTDLAPLTYKQRMRWTTTTSGSLWKMFYSPFYVAFLPHVIFTSLQYATGVAWLIILASVTSISFSYPPYNFSTAGIGYMNLGPFVGNIFGSIYAGIFGDWAITWLAKRNNGYYEPEFRLYTLLPPSICISGGLIMFGVTTDRGMHWIWPSVGGGFFAFGLGAIGDAAMTLLIDAYQPLTGDAFISVAFFRNLLSIGVGFSISPWMENYGLTKMFITCGVLALFVSLLHIPLIIYGKRIRIALAPRYYKLLKRQSEVYS